MLDIQEKHWQIIKHILSKYPYTFYAFGSRAKHHAKKFSDLDLCYKEKIPIHDLSKIQEDFEESDLPFKVDLIDWNTCDPDFQKLIEKDLIILKA